ncbi:MAG: formyltransferase family protein, partial [Fidelibacterota bacterium]
MPSLRIAVFASGRGSNFRSIVKSINRGDLDAEIAFVLSNNPDPGAFEFAREENIKTIHLTSRSFSSQDEFDDKLLGVLKEHDVNLIVLAGYMKKLSPRIVKAYRNRIVNIHPALL